MKINDVIDRFTSKAYSAVTLSRNFHFYQLKVPKQLTQKLSIFGKMWYFQVSCLGTLSWYSSLRCKTIKRAIDFDLFLFCFDLFWFESNLRRIHFIELSSELEAPILDRFKKKMDFVFFLLGISNFGLGAWFPFHKGQFNID